MTGLGMAVFRENPAPREIIGIVLALASMVFMYRVT